MRLRPVSRRWRATAGAAVLMLSVGRLASCSAGGPASDPGSVSRAAGGSGESRVRVLQMNLCDSGLAGCYSGGRSVAMAAELIRQNRPDMVSLNEVCRDDVGVLTHAMSATVHGARIASAFRPADDRVTQAPYLCQDGQQFGDAVLASIAAGPPGSRVHGGVYPIQDLSDPEERTWVCLDLAPRFAACTTHTASTAASVALAQCRYLLGSALPTMSRRDGADAIVLGADLNLAADGWPSPQSCLPPGYQRVDDGALQDVVVSPGLDLGSHSIIDMRGTTDHPALLVDVVLPRR